jgi:hypothetical protein
MLARRQKFPAHPASLRSEHSVDKTLEEKDWSLVCDLQHTLRSGSLFMSVSLLLKRFHA